MILVILAFTLKSSDDELREYSWTVLLYPISVTYAFIQVLILDKVGIQIAFDYSKVNKSKSRINFKKSEYSSYVNNRGVTYKYKVNLYVLNVFSYKFLLRKMCKEGVVQTSKSV
jgi:hypothetical protein